jgi:hypothetical protein
VRRTISLGTQSAEYAVHRKRHDMPPVIGRDAWYETRDMGDGIALIHEPWIKPFYRCNMWHVRGRDRDLLLDTGLGHFPLRAAIGALRERPVVCVASHTHFDHIGGHHEFGERCVHRAEAAILADPRNDWTLADRYATDEMFDGFPDGWDAARYRVKPAPATRLLEDGDVVDLGDRHFEVVHTPGHSPGGIALWEARTKNPLLRRHRLRRPVDRRRLPLRARRLRRIARTAPRIARRGRAWGPFRQFRPRSIGRDRRRVSGGSAGRGMPSSG